MRDGGRAGLSKKSPKFFVDTISRTAEVACTFLMNSNTVLSQAARVLCMSLSRKTIFCICLTLAAVATFWDCRK